MGRILGSIAIEHENTARRIDADMPAVLETHPIADHDVYEQRLAG